jgi:hypothetical protein
MSTEGEKCLKLVLLDDSNYESWCISILNNIESFNPYLLSIVDSSICLPNITWANLSKEEKMLETKCSIYLSTNSILESKCRSLNPKGTWGSNGCSLTVKIYQRKYFRDHSNTRLKRS